MGENREENIYREKYFTLSHAIREATDLTEKALQVLVDAQWKCEELLMKAGGEDASKKAP